MLGVFVVGIAIFAGLACGWWLRGNDPRYLRIRSQAADAARTRQALNALRDLTHNVASDVDKHKALMSRIYDELNANTAKPPTAVLQAVDKLIEVNERMQQQLQSAEVKLEDQARQIASQTLEANTDALTGLSNRRAFDRELARAYRAAIDHGVPTVVMMIDVDHFKSLNDTYGHQAADSVLRGIGELLLEKIPDNHFVARYGGEEFAAIFPNTELEQVERLVEQVRLAIGQREYEYDGLELRVTVSVGLAQFSPGESASSLLGRADDALYASKEKGRDCAHFHNGEESILLCHGIRQSTRAPVEPRIKPPYDVGISSPEDFSTDLRRRLSEWRSGGAPLCVLFVQIDDLDDLLEEYSEDNLQAMLRAVTLTLKASMREIDHAARFEGHALSLLLPGTTLRGAIAVAERLRQAAGRCQLPPRFARQHFTVSIGVAEAQADENEDHLIERVRDSLTVAHMHGHDCTYVHDGEEFHLIGVGSVSAAH